MQGLCLTKAQDILPFYYTVSNKSEIPPCNFFTYLEKTTITKCLNVTTEVMGDIKCCHAEQVKLIHSPDAFTASMCSYLHS